MWYMLWHSEAPIFIQPEAVKNSSLVCSHHCVMHTVQLKYHQPYGPSVLCTRHNQLSTDNPSDPLAINVQYTLTIQVILWPQTFNTETNHKNMDQEKEPTHFILSCRDTDNPLPVPCHGQTGLHTDLVEMCHGYEQFIFRQINLVCRDLLYTEGACAPHRQLFQRNVLSLHWQDLVADDLQQPENTHTAWPTAQLSLAAALTGSCWSPTAWKHTHCMTHSSPQSHCTDRIL